MGEQPRELGAARLAGMDAAGITLQVLSVAQKGAKRPPTAASHRVCGDDGPMFDLALAPFMPLLMTFGAGRIVLSVDDLFSPNGRGFLDASPVSPGDKAKLAHGHADKLLTLKAGQAGPA